nr:MAG TPA: 30S ribosomal protein S27 [Caudoviricetes sp.]
MKSYFIRVKCSQRFAQVKSTDSHTYNSNNVSGHTGVQPTDLT